MDVVHVTNIKILIFNNVTFILYVMIWYICTKSEDGRYIAETCIWLWILVNTFCGSSLSIRISINKYVNKIKALTIFFSMEDCI